MEARREWVDSIFGVLDGARVEVDSTVGEGSTFSMFLPVEGK
jgi:light-regulated signal transduction histidine kinase (bacteriophytochrome)